MNQSADSEIELPSLGMSLYGMQGGGVTPDNEPYWRAAAERRYTVPACEDCGTHRWPMDLVCYACGSTRWSWQEVPGTGVVYTYTWIDSPTHPGTVADNVVIVEVDGTKGEPVRVSGWVVGVEQGELACGMRVKIDYEIINDHIGVPFWKPAEGS